jgi:tripartite-type tricarboxylate transporter receptor subunit TctC
VIRITERLTEVYYVGGESAAARLVFEGEIVMRDKLNYSFIRDFAPVAGISRAANVMEVNLSVPVKTVPEFIAYAKGNPGKINMASTGIGASPHLSGELFKLMTGVNMLHVPYRGNAPALTDLLGGQVQVLFDAISSSIEHIRAEPRQAPCLPPCRAGR